MLSRGILSYHIVNSLAILLHWCWVLFGVQLWREFIFQYQSILGKDYTPSPLQSFFMGPIKVIMNQNMEYVSFQFVQVGAHIFGLPLDYYFKVVGVLAAISISSGFRQCQMSYKCHSMKKGACMKKSFHLFSQRPNIYKVYIERLKK